MCRVRLVGYTGPMYGASVGSSCTTYGRPDRSTATCTSTSSSGTIALPNRRMPALSPSASANAVPERERGVLHRVVGVDLQVAGGVHAQVEAAVLAELGEHVVVEADAGRDRRRARCRRGRPARAPCVSWVLRSTRPRALSHEPLLIARRNASVSSGVPAVTRSHPAQPHVAHEHARSSSARHTADWSSKRPNSTKLASLSATVSPSPRSSATIRSRCSLIASTGPAAPAPGHRGPRGGLGERRQVVRQPHQLQCVDHRRVGRQVADPGAGERERLAHGAGDDQPRVPRQQRRARCGVPGRANSA